MMMYWLPHCVTPTPTWLGDAIAPAAISEGTPVLTLVAQMSPFARKAMQYGMSWTLAKPKNTIGELGVANSAGPMPGMERAVACPIGMKLSIHEQCSSSMEGRAASVFMVAKPVNTTGRISAGIGPWPSDRCSCWRPLTRPALSGSGW